MAVSLATENGVIYIPQAVAQYRVANTPSGVATSGILVLVGESSQGPDHASETDLADTYFGPNQAGEVAAKYGEGALVDAFNIACVPSASNDITGAPAGLYILKTNPSGKASGNMVRSGLTNYGVLADRNYGEPGNGISFVMSESTSEVQPTSTFTYTPTPASSTLGLRTNGGSTVSSVIASLTSPPAFAAQMSALSNFPIEVIGGQALAVITAWANTDTVALVASGNNVVITGSVAWDNTPAAGDMLVIPVLDGGGPAEWYETAQASVLIGAGSANVGIYLVTAATSTTISATKVHDLVSETPTAPVTVTATAVGSVHDDIKVYKSVQLSGRTGTFRDVIATVSGTITGTASGNSLSLVRSINWDATPQVNDKIYIQAGSAFVGAGSANVGWYTVTSSSVTTVAMTKLDTTTAPVSFIATAQAASTDLICRRPAIDGVGKSIELTGTTNGDAILRSSANTAVLPLYVTSASEQVDKIVAQKLSNGTTEEITFGGDVMLTVGYLGTTATMTLTNSLLTTTVTGGAGANLSITLKNYKTVGELASFISSQTGYYAAAGNNLLAQSLLYPDKDGVLVLDKGTYGIATTQTNKAGRVKKDGRATYAALAEGSVLLQVGTTPAAPSTGLPEAQILTFLTGGTRGATTDANVLAALRSAEKLRCNFVIPLFSRDATEDIADFETDPSSTYTIDSVHALTKSHVIAMSALKRGRYRQAFLSYRGTFNEAKNKSTTLANFRCSLAIEDFKGTSATDGSIVQFQPWATATNAAATQAAGFYRDITGKLLNTSGVLYNDSTFDPNDDTDVEVALQSGILLARAPSDGTGGYEWVSDQTTYGVDNNFLFNSIQAIYAADLVTASAKQGMEKSFKGASLADVSAASGIGVLSSILDTMKRIKLLSASDDAPAGYKNIVVRIQGNAMFCSAEIKLATGIKFIKIDFVVSEVQQSASL